MTNQYLRNTTADYITGAVSACEGIKGSIVLINGPHGCKTYYGFGTGQSVVNGQALLGLGGDLRLRNAMDDRLIRSQFFTGSPLIPATNLRYEDFIFGTSEQLCRALNDILAERKYSLISVIQAPGTSLLSEALEAEIRAISERSDVPYVYIDVPGLSEDMFKGYDETALTVIKRFVHPDRRSAEEHGDISHRRASVNIFGLYSRGIHVDGDLAELARLLGLCEIDINCACGAYCTLDDIRRIPEADANIFLAPERTRQTKAYLEEAFDIPSFDLGCIPVGPDLTESFIRGISKLLNTDCSAAVRDIEETRATVFYHLARNLGARGFDKAFKYAAEGEPSLLYALIDYLTGYLGIAPEAIHPLYDQSRSGTSRIRTILEDIGFEEALSADITKVRDIVLFANANTIAQVLSYSGNVYGVETAYPTSGYINVVPKTFIGCRGALYILEQVLNARRMLKAWDR